MPFRAPRDLGPFRRQLSESSESDPSTRWGKWLLGARAALSEILGPVAGVPQAHAVWSLEPKWFALLRQGFPPSVAQSEIERFG